MVQATWSNGKGVLWVLIYRLSVFCPDHRLFYCGWDIYRTFCLTGLQEDKARFSGALISCMTNSGFTTRESELILNSRRGVTWREWWCYLAIFLRCLGFMVLIQFIYPVFRRSDQLDVDSLFVYFLVVILVITRSKWIIRKFDELVEKDWPKVKQKGGPFAIMSGF